MVSYLFNRDPKTPRTSARPMELPIDEDTERAALFIIASLTVCRFDAREGARGAGAGPPHVRLAGGFAG